jgi:protein arginine kinase activator
MLCENCKKNEAVVRSTELSNGKPVRENQLCEECASEAGLPQVAPKVISLSDLFGLLNLGQTAKREAEVRCPDCGMTLRDFRTKGRLGCPKDYEIFRGHLEGLLEKIQGSTKHVGRVPSRAAAAPRPAKGAARPDEGIEELRRKLRDAVENERYEEAARLRDRISEIESAGGGSSAA